jgi:cytochrome c peroxidase
MASSTRLLLAAALLALAPACGSEGGAPQGPTGDGGRQTDDGGRQTGGDSAVSGEDPEGPAPTLTTEQRSALATLHYDASAPPTDVSNAVADDPATRVFGQRLFFETAFSGALLESDNTGAAAHLGKMGETGKVSCAGCHIPSSGFVDTRSPNRQISLASGWTRRRTPSLLEVALRPLYNWDGQRDTLWNQAIGVFENAAEFNTSRLFIARQVLRLHRAEYEAIFGALPDMADTAIYPALSAAETGCNDDTEHAPCRGKPGDKADYDGMSADAQHAVTVVTVNVAKAIAAYLRLLRCGPSRFDRWLEGESAALTRSEQRGAALFVGKANCISCHSGSNLSDGDFHNVGLRPAPVAVAFTDTGDRGAAEGIALALTDPLSSAGIYSDGDRGQLPSSVAPRLEGAFHTPMLRCLNGQPSFMHTGQLQSLISVVRFFSRGGDSAGFPGMNELTPVGLTELEQADLVAFMQALQGPGPEAALLTAPPL